MKRITLISFLSIIVAVASIVTVLTQVAYPNSENENPQPIVPESSKTIIVPTDYITIQEAINKAPENAAIYVQKGVYVENPIVNKTLFLIGEDRDSTVIDVTSGLSIQSNNVVFTGFTVYDGWRCISLSGNNCRVYDNRLKDATNGIVLFGCNNNSVTENVFESIGLSSAIQLNYANYNSISTNHIQYCVEGIQIWQGSCNNTIIANNIIDCQETGVSFQYSHGNLLKGNDIIRCGRCGASIYGSSWNIVTQNSFIDNKLQFGANEEYYLSWGNPPSVNTIESNYWSNYNGVDANGDGIGDTPYEINENNKDLSPQAQPVT